MQFKKRIGQDSAQVLHDQGRPEGAEDDQLGVGTGNDKATNEDIIIRADVRTGRDVQSLRRRINRGDKRT